jgi:hypothetical protein
VACVGIAVDAGVRDGVRVGVAATARVGPGEAGRPACWAGLRSLSAKLGHVRGWHLEASNRLSPGGVWSDPTGWVWPPAILNVTVPLGLMVTWAGCHWLRRCRRSPRCAWPGRGRRRQEAGGRWSDVKQRRAQMAYRAWRSRVEGIYGLASDDVCVAFQREKGPTPDG